MNWMRQIKFSQFAAFFFTLVLMGVEQDDWARTMFVVWALFCCCRFALGHLDQRKDG